MARARSVKQYLTASLSRRLGLNLFAYILFGLIAILLLLGTVIDDRFSRLENKEIEGHVERSKAMLQLFEDTARTRALDWAVWDESFEYLRAPNRAYEDANLNLSSMQNIEISAMSLVRFDGSLAKTIFFDLQSGEPDLAAASLFEQKVSNPGFAAIMRGAEVKTGFMRVGDRVLVVAGAKVLRSDETGAPQGYLVMGKILSDADIAQALQLPAHIGSYGTPKLPTVTRGANRVSIVERIDGFGGEPVAAIRFSVPRSLHQEGVNLLWLTVGGVALLLTAMILLLNWRLRSVLIRPVAAFQAHVSHITASGDLAHFPDKGRGDELGALYREFNRMTDELESLRAKVEAQSFAIGKNESATDIMHNVRNAISPVQAILGKLDQRLRFPAEEKVERALQELAVPASAERRANLVTFVKAAMAKFQADLTQHRSDVREALRSVGHVDEAITAVRSSDRSLAQAPASCDLTQVIGSSSVIARHSQAAEVSVEFDSEERFRITTPRVLLAQIIDNLLTNAVEAIVATGRGRGTIGIEAVSDPDDPEHFVCVTICDDGDGFVPDMAAKLFERGQSGRNKVRGGIGLHWCANTLNAYGGSISLRSDGPGSGSCAMVRLPIARAEQIPSEEQAHADAA